MSLSCNFKFRSSFKFLKGATLQIFLSYSSKLMTIISTLKVFNCDKCQRVFIINLSMLLTFIFYEFSYTIEFTFTCLKIY